ncbi:MAG: A/G-specific adenine glycosylase [Myxococcota bacterium]
MSERASLLRWYRRHRRDLPWRRTRDPYAIWISEAMLQQTRVETVLPYYQRFLGRFPDIASLAGAELDDVLGHWAGLGYYSRARNLKRAAEMVMDRFEGSLPDEATELQRLPGVGRYTAGAIASIAFDRPDPVLDGNVTRVLTRLRGIHEDVGRPEVRARLWDEAAALARGANPGDLNQALMELGARVCTPRSPCCQVCPLRRSCQAEKEGNPEALPHKAPRARPRRVRAGAVWLRRRGRALAVRRPEQGLLGGLWELPGAPLARGARPEASLAAALEASLGIPVSGLEALGQVEHTFTHRQLTLLVFAAEPGPGRLRRRSYSAHRWVTPAAFHELPQGRVNRKALALASPPSPRRPLP